MHAAERYKIAFFIGFKFINLHYFVIDIDIVYVKRMVRSVFIVMISTCQWVQNSDHSRFETQIKTISVQLAVNASSCTKLQDFSCYECNKVNIQLRQSHLGQFINSQSHLFLEVIQDDGNCI